MVLAVEGETLLLFLCGLLFWGFFPMCEILENEILYLDAFLSIAQIIKLFLVMKNLVAPAIVTNIL